MGKLREWVKRWLGPSDADLEIRRRLEKLEEGGKGLFSTHVQHPVLNLDAVEKVAFPIRSVAEVDSAGKAMDSCQVPMPNYKFTTRGGIPDNIVGWFLSQSFIGFQMCTVMSQHWLINRACKIPAEDATRNGWKVNGGDAVEALDKKMNIKKHASEFARFNRVFGIRIAIMCVKSSDPKFYENPFNPDSVAPGSYTGISQVDPIWCSPEFDQRDLADPTSKTFYEPTYWRIMGKRYHRSHLVVIRYAEVPDLLKPTYQFAGLSLPQLIWERVYCAERSANEGPQLLLTKRMNVLKTDLDEAMADIKGYAEKSQAISDTRDNYGILTIGESDEYQQHETSLGDFDSVVMTGYQLVAGVAEMPSTKLLGTSPKGFNATGEFEMGNYRETLATIQEHHCGPLLEAHYLRAFKSLGVDETVEIVWNPLDEPTEAERADTQLKKAQTRQIYQDLGVVSAEQNQRVILNDPESGYTQEDYDGEEADVEAAIHATRPGNEVRQAPGEVNQGDEQGPQVPTQANG